MRIGSVIFAVVVLSAASSWKREPEKYQVRYEWRQGTVVEKWEAGVRAPDGTVKDAEFVKLKVWDEEKSEVVIEDVYFDDKQMDVGDCWKFYAEIHERGNQREIRPSSRNLELCYEGGCTCGF